MSTYYLKMQKRSKEKELGRYRKRLKQLNDISGNLRSDFENNASDLNGQYSKMKEHTENGIKFYSGGSNCISAEWSFRDLGSNDEFLSEAGYEIGCEIRDVEEKIRSLENEISSLGHRIRAEEAREAAEAKRKAEEAARKAAEAAEQGGS